MSTITLEREFSDELRELMRDMDGKRFQLSIKSRIGIVKLNDGRKAQVHLIVTADKDDFLSRQKSKQAN